MSQPITTLPHGNARRTERDDFVDALYDYVRTELANSTQPADYNNEAVQVVDARNHYFRNVGTHGMDEEHGIYPLRALCRVDEDTMETVPDRMRLQAIAREYGLE